MVMMLLLSRIEADCLSSQHRKQIYTISKNILLRMRSRLPRERFSPLADNRLQSTNNLYMPFLPLPCQSQSLSARTAANGEDDFSKLTGRKLRDWAAVRR
jgi:hypothetical protein